MFDSSAVFEKKNWPESQVSFNICMFYATVFCVCVERSVSVDLQRQEDLRTVISNMNEMSGIWFETTEVYG